jgi:diguanylate cyclase (GGDEF)-like protein
MAARWVSHPTILASLLVTTLTVGIREMGGWQSLELLSLDRMTQLRPSTGPDPRLLIVTITDEDIQHQRQWPLSDATIAKMLQNLQQHHPHVIGLDIYRDLPAPPGTSALAKQLKMPNVVAITLLGEDEQHSVPPPPGMPEAQIGFSDFLVDSDAVIRRCLLFANNQNDRLYSLALQLSLVYLGNRQDFQVQANALKIGNTVFPAMNSRTGGYQDLDDLGYQMLVSYRMGQDIGRQVSLEQVLQNQVNPEWIKDKIILIGTTAASAKDLFLTPYNKMRQHSPTTPGVMIHAQITSQILGAVLDGKPLVWYWSEGWEILWIGAWAWAGSLLAWWFRQPSQMIGSILVAGVALGGSCFGLFLLEGWVPLVPAAIALAGTTSCIVAYRLLHDTFHDPLTQLPNRTHFLRYLQRATTPSGASKATTTAVLRWWRGPRASAPPLATLPALDYALSSDSVASESPAYLAVLSIGLNGFKTVNDSLGHPLGDQLLVEMTRRLQTCLAAGDRIGRVGGDEFAIVRQQVQQESEIALLAERLRQQWSYPFHLEKHEVFISASVGIALNGGNPNYLPEDILRDANTAMHQAKASGKACHQMFASGMRLQRVTRLQLETDLHYALERQELQLHYQPIVALGSGKIVGFEALSRWFHPVRGLVSPTHFIPIAEATDLIIPLGHWAIQTACQQLCKWQASYPQTLPLVMSVNLSGKQFSQVHLVENVEAILQQTGLAPEQLKLEITESVAMTDAEAAIAMLGRLRGLNLQLSIDDFGTGYSSLSYLHRFPTSTIKVDRSFVGRMGRGNEENQIVQTIIMLGHNLGMDIVAEGIETPEQLELLRELGCDYGQGYLFSEPLRVEEAEALLSSQPQW